MTRHECPREADVLDALASGEWPRGRDADLRAHAARCEACADLVAVAIPLLDDRETAYAAHEIPSAAIVWWKAQRRARADAAGAAARPILVAQCLALACTVGLVAGLLRFLLPHASAIGAAAGARMSALQALSPAVAAPWVALAALLVLAPVAVYLATASD